MLSFITKNFRQLGSKIVGGAAGTFALNIVNQILLLLITMILTRIMGPADYGLYAIVVSVMLLLALPFSGGLPVFIIRHVSAAVAQKRFDLFHGLINCTFLWVLGGSIIMAAVAYLLLPFIVQNQANIYRVGLGLAVFPPLLLFSGSILRALRHVILGRFSEFFVQPMLLAGILLLLLLNAETLSPQTALTLHASSYVLALLVSVFILMLFYPKEARSAKPVYEMKKWVKSALPLMVAVGLIVVNSNIDIVMVGALAGEAEAGQYRVATRMAAFSLFFLFAANNAMGAVISARHTQGKHEELQNSLTSVARLTMLCTLPVVVVLWLWPVEILGFLFGSAFIAGATALIILAGANFFSVSMGQVGHVLSLTGNENYTAYAALIAMIMNVILNSILIPLYGLNGAAVATGTSIITWNALLAYWTVQKTGYHCTILGPIRKRRV